MLQVLEITDKVVVAVNLMDEARRKGIDVDVRSLSRDLGVPAVPVVARTGEGMSRAAVVGRGRHQRRDVRPSPRRPKARGSSTRRSPSWCRSSRRPRRACRTRAWIAIRLLDGDGRVEQALRAGELATLVARQQRPDDRFSRKIALQGAQ